MATNKNNTKTSLFSRATHGIYTVEDQGNSTGNRFWVDSGKASTGGDTQGFGSSPDMPFLTLDYAVASASGHLTADNGDIIYVMPGHTESVTEAGDITMGVAGVTVIGLGGIGDRPVITFDTIDSADLEIDAANITIKNISFRCNIADLAAAIDVDAAHFHIKDCSFVGTDAADEAFLITIIGDGNADDMIVESCDFNYLTAEDATAITTTSTACIVIAGGARTKVIDCYMSGDFTVSAINNSGTAAANIQLLENRIANTATGNISGAIDIHASSTGFWHHNICYAADPTSANDVVDDGGLVTGLNWVTNDLGEAPIIWGTADAEGVEGKVDTLIDYHDVPVADSTSNAQGFEVVGNKDDAAATGAVTTSESLVAYAKQNVGAGIANAAALVVIDDFHDVPAADSTSNAQMNEVIGNKDDTAASGGVTTSESITAYVKQNVGANIANAAALVVIDDFHDVPAANSTSNAQMNEVVGNKDDAAATGAVTTSESITAYVKQNATAGIAAAAALVVIDEFHDVPAADSTSNAQMNEVIGNKDDAAASGAVTTSESITAYVKQNVGANIALTALHDVPAADSTSNAQMNEVLGNKDDAQPRGAATTSDSAQGYLKQLINTSDPMHYDAANYLAVTADFTSATWNVTTNTHEIATVTGLVRVRIIPQVAGNITDADNNCLIRLGTDVADDLFIGDTTATALDDTELWYSTTAADNIPSLALSNIQDYILDGGDIGYTLDTTALTGGTMIFNIWWEALNAAGAVAAGEGGTL